MDKPEFVYAEGRGFEKLGVSSHCCPFWADGTQEAGDIKFRITYNEAGEVIRLERVET